MRSTIVIIEDTVEIAEFVQEVLVENGYDCYVSLTAVEGLDRVEQVKPELVLLDINLPDLTGIDVFKKIKSLYPDVKIVMFTSESHPDSVAKGLNLGADDYITKPVDSNVLLARVSARLRKQADSGKLKVADVVIDEGSHEVTRDGKHIELSAQEYKLLVFLVHNKNQVMSREMILSRIWSGNPDIETRVVDVYIGYLRKKIDFKEPKLLVSKRGFGYMIQEPK